MSVPKFSIVTVVLDDVVGLQETYQSLEAQTFQDFEWLVVSGGSGRPTLAFLDSITDRRLAWLDEPDEGIYDGMSKGVSLGKGRYVVFLNAGDTFVDSTVLAAVSEALAVAAEPDVLACAARLIFPNGNVVERPPRRVDKYIWHGLPSNHQATFFRRAAVVGPWYDTRLRCCGDYYLMATLFTLGARWAYSPRAVVNFDMTGVSSRSPRTLLAEAAFVQRQVLGQPALLVATSAVRRTCSIIGAMVTNRIPLPPLQRVR